MFTLLAVRKEGSTEGQRPFFTTAPDASLSRLYSLFPSFQGAIQQSEAAG
jgi:hypothetical protein